MVFEHFLVQFLVSLHNVIKWLDELPELLFWQRGAPALASFILSDQLQALVDDLLFEEIRDWLEGGELAECLRADKLIHTRVKGLVTNVRQKSTYLLLTTFMMPRIV